MSVLGKVGNIGEISKVGLGKQTLRMAEGTITDLTGNTPISLLEDNLTLINPATIYKITNTCVHFWNGAKKLTTSPNSIISSIQDDKLKGITKEEPSEVPQEDELTVVVPLVKNCREGSAIPSLRTLFKKAFTSHSQCVSKV